MKKLICVGLTALLLVGLMSGCGCDDGRDFDLVFVNESDATIVAVVADFEGHTSGTQHADSSPLKRSETFGFEAGTYPVTVVVYGDVELLEELARLTVGEAPAAGERWYVTARDSIGGMTLSADIQRPEEG